MPDPSGCRPHRMRQTVSLVTCHQRIDVATCGGCSLRLVRREETGAFWDADRCERCSELRDGSEPRPLYIEAVDE